MKIAAYILSHFFPRQRMLPLDFNTIFPALRVWRLESCCCHRSFQRDLRSQWVQSHLHFSPSLRTYEEAGQREAQVPVLNDIICATDNKDYCVAASVDLAKAPESVDHVILVDRLGDIRLSDSYCSSCLHSMNVEEFLSDSI